ncbi:hydroxylamine reductase [Limibacterium fermenti]|uniref:hydroxylamine reductase n=1 Tax=Limibacterium fermenti TaxID=3229863 RepID=UPI000E7EA0F9|nr:hydroxylamine reductase [Porphyromonadaceae bacterium]
MFCFQCQETAKNEGCTVKGVCGKTATVANLQDLLVFLCKGISHYTVRLRDRKIEIPEINRFITDSLFMTITNANFDKSRFITRILMAYELRNAAKEKYLSSGGDINEIAFEGAFWTGEREEQMAEKAEQVGILTTENEDICSLRELTIYGLKGMAAYAEHAYNLGYTDDGIYAFMQKALVATADDSLSVDELTGLVLETGQYGVQVMALLDKANTSSYGNPEITMVNLGVRNNPGILISGHDMKDMEELLKQTEGTGVDVYTHSEMLPANYYPAFKKYAHFVGNYGSSWWHQTEDFEHFNGVILFTTNCIVPPKKSATYTGRVYTTGATGFEGFKHIEDRKDGRPKDFSAVIEHAKQCASPEEIETGTIVGGFAHNQVIALADKVIDAVKTGAIRKFFVMGGCDGRMRGRNYYTEFAEKLPKDTVILTAGCAKYRYNKLSLGDINGIPRVLDAGQCNDSYSLVKIALALKEAFGLDDLNDLPIAYNIAWYEQKAVIVLLALLSLGVKNIHLGPTLPAFLSPNVANVLVRNFGIAGISSVDEDMKVLLSVKRHEAVKRISVLKNL